MRSQIILALSILISSLSSPIIAQQLRIETDVFLGDEVEPLTHNVTLFNSGTVYDFVESPKQITIFRPPTSLKAGQFILLDLDAKKRTEITTDRIAGLMEKLTKWASDQDDAMLKFSAKHDFEESFDQSSGALSLKSSLWNYTVATVPADDADKLASYREFTDWFSQLNAMLYGNPPPGPRLSLNDALERNGVVPVEIRREIDSNSSTVRATHLFTWRLSREDLARIEKAQEYLAEFKKVDNKAYLTQRGKTDVVRGQSEE